MQSRVLTMLVDALKAVLGENGIIGPPTDVSAFTEDWRGRYRGLATCVALPANTEQVAATVKLCAEAGVRVLAQGGNTSFAAARCRALTIG